MASLFEHDDSSLPCQGTIFRMRPIFWIQPPITIVRAIDYTSQRAWVYREPDWPSDAFRRREADNQEDTLARTKVRYVVVLSPDFEAGSPLVRELVVAPIYSMPVDRPDLCERIKSGRWPDQMYLAADPAFPDIGEAFINFRNVQPMVKEILNGHKLPYKFNRDARDAIIDRYRAYFVYELGAHR